MESEISYGEYKQFNSSQNSTGLLRFRSAPSSYFANWDEKSEKNGAENQGLTSSFDFEERKGIVNGYSLNPQLPPQYPRNQLGSVNGGYRAQNSLEIDSDLMRQNNPLFPAQTGYGSLRNIGGYGYSGGNNGDLSPSSNRAQASQMEFSSAMPSSTLGMLSRISEVENETEKLRIGGRDAEYYSPELPFSSWNQPTKFGDNLSGLKREMDCDDQTLIHDTVGGGPRNRLSHHLSLPKTSAQVAAMDKLLQLQDTVPCKLRAKRGCATHPRSIAERVRRTRISERMRRLQELVPNMEKQTNTSDMLDLAVDYIKELQKQYKALSDIRAKCKCSAIQKPVSGHKC